MAEKNYDLIIIGGGPGGYELAAEQAGAGKRVALVEKDRLGGTCLNRGCIPTKCLCSSADAIRTVQNAAQFGVDVPAFTLSYPKAAERMRSVVDTLRSGIGQMLRGVEVIEAEARLAPGGTAVCPVSVIAGEDTLMAPEIIIATGSRPARLPIPGAELAIDSDDLLALDELPGSVAIIGGGVIGMEFASILAAFGTEVTVIEYCKEILPPFDGEIAKRLRLALGRRGIKIVTGASAREIARTPDGLLRVDYETAKGAASIEAEAVLMAVGRRPVLPPGCEEAGIELTPKGFIKVDGAMRTSVPGVYAVGDVNGLCMLAHAASAQSRVAAGEEVDLTIIPSAVFTHPEAAMAGATEESLKASGAAYATAKSLFGANGKAVAMGEGEGLVKVIYAPADGSILGVHILGPHASDIAAEAAALMFGKVTVDDAATSLVHGHPTLSEALSAACGVAKQAILKKNA